MSQKLAGSLSPSPAYAAAPFAFAGHDPRIFPTLPQAAPRLPRSRRRRKNVVLDLLHAGAHSRFLGTALVIVFLGSAAAFGAVRGGAYDAYVAANGTPANVVARLAGFSIKAVTITGARELRENEILKLAGVGPQSSLLFLDVAAVRARLKAVPLIKEASVSKLFPERLLIEIEERQPYALWQKDGIVSVVAADGAPIDDMHDPRFQHLPLVVGDGANGRLPEYLAILDAAGDLKDRVRAGIYVSGRRWTIKMDNNVEIELPENDAAQTMTRFAQLEHDGHILEKDILSVDLRMPDRVVARLTADAGAARAAAIAAKTKKKGAST